MNKKDKKNSNNWTQEERDRLVSLFDLLLKIDKRQNPNMYKTKKNNEDMVVLDKDGNEVKL